MRPSTPSDRCTVPARSVPGADHGIGPSNAQSTLKLGHARAAALIAPARAGLPVAEYSTRLVKKAVVGTGAADKAQIGFMIARLLPTAGKTTADCADALAVAITHANLRIANRRVA